MDGHRPKLVIYNEAMPESGIGKIMPKVYELAKELWPLAYIAGGFYKDIARGIEPKDFDIFCCNKYDFEEVCEIVEEFTQEEQEEKNASIKYGKFEVVKPMVIRNRRLWGTPEEMVPTFDMSINMVYVHPHNGIVALYDDIDEQIEAGKYVLFIDYGDEIRASEREQRYEAYGFTPEDRVRRMHYSKAGGGGPMHGGWYEE